MYYPHVTKDTLENLFNYAHSHYLKGEDALGKTLSNILDYGAAQYAYAHLRCPKCKSYNVDMVFHVKGDAWAQTVCSDCNYGTEPCSSIKESLNQWWNPDNFEE